MFGPTKRSFNGEESPKQIHLTKAQVTERGLISWQISGVILSNYVRTFIYFKS